MLKFDVVQTNKHSIKILLAEKPPIFTSRKSLYKTVGINVSHKTNQNEI